MLIKIALLLLLSLIFVKADELTPEFTQAQTSLNENKKIKRIAYVNSVKSWWGPNIIYESFGLNSCYDIIILCFWMSQQGSQDAVLLYEHIYDYMGSDQFGSSNSEVQHSMIQLFHSQNKQLFVSAFGGTDFPTSQNPIEVANRFIKWIENNPYIDGIDIDYEDNEAILQGSGVDWVVQFQKQLSFRLGNMYTITHAPQASYFSKEYYNGGGYYQIDKQVGDLIDWYNVQFYNQGRSNPYDSYEKLFLSSGLPFSGTSIFEIIEINGISKEKLILGKPASVNDVVNTGLMDPLLLYLNIKYAKQEHGYDLPGFFIWELKNDPYCLFANTLINGQQQVEFNQDDQQLDIGSQYNNRNDASQIQEDQSLFSSEKQSLEDQDKIQINEDDKKDKNELVKFSTDGRNVTSIAFIDKLDTWWGPTVINQFGINSCYDVLILTEWLSTNGPFDAVYAYKYIHNYIGSNLFGKNNLEVQKYIKNTLNKDGKILMISAFNNAEFPTSKDPVKIAQNFASFINSVPYIDGIDIGYYDVVAMVNGRGVQWLIEFISELDTNLENKNLLISLSTNISFFSPLNTNTGGGLITVNNQIGNFIDWYNVKLGSKLIDYNQNLFQNIFISNIEQTSVNQLVSLGIPLKKIAIESSPQYLPKLGQYINQFLDRNGETLPAFYIPELSDDKDCSSNQQFKNKLNSLIQNN